MGIDFDGDSTDGIVVITINFNGYCEDSIDIIVLAVAVTGERLQFFRVIYPG